MPVIETLPFYRIWWFLIITYLMAYMDFSAYSDIAIGSSRLFGIRIAENFAFPITATNIGEFWRRWHMTLAGWCQRYIYMPTIGLTRRPYLAAYATFLLMGLWHDASGQWIAWGAYHATGIVVHQLWSRWIRSRRGKQPVSLFSKILGWMFTFLFVSGGYAFVAGYSHAPLADSFRLLFHALALPII